MAEGLRRRAGAWPVAPPGAARDGGRLTRRSALRAAVGAGGAALAGTWLAACGPSNTPAAASTTPAQAITKKLLWRPWYNFTNATSPTGRQLLLQGIQPWLDQNPGVGVDITYMGYQGTTVTALLAGTGPDIFADWVLPLYLEPGLILNLAPYARQDNVDMSIFPSLEMELFQQRGGLWAFPSYLHLEAPTANLGVLDTLGFQYPQNGWTWQDWTSLWQKVSNKVSGKSRRVGGQFYWSGYDYGGGNPHAYYLKGFGGEYVDPTNPMKCYLSNPNSVQCMQWIYGLLQNGEAATGSQGFTTGVQVTSAMDTAGGLIGAAENWGSVKWQIYDEMIWPKGKVAYAASDFYAISAATKEPDLAWSFLKYLCVDTQWQTWMMKLAMNGPNQKRLYAQWVTELQNLAPPLKRVDLAVFQRQMEGNEPYFGLTFEYNDSGCKNAISSNTAPAQASGGESVVVAMNNATNVVDQVEIAARAQAASTQQITKEFPANGKTIAPVPAGI